MAGPAGKQNIHRRPCHYGYRPDRIDEEEKITADAIEKGKSEAEFEETLNKTAQAAFDPLKLLMGEVTPPSGKGSDEKTMSMPSLYADDFHYLKDAIGYLKQSETLQSEFVESDQQVILTATPELEHRLRYVLPKEVWPKDNTFVLSADPDAVQDEIKRSRKDENAWPRIHYLWQQNPVLEWINNKVVAGFGRHEAPVLSLQGALAREEAVFILTGLVPNLKGHPLVHQWFGVTFQNGVFQKIETFASLLARTGLGRTTFPNQEENHDRGALKNLLPEAVKQAKHYMSKERKIFEDKINPKLQKHLDNLERLKGKHHERLELIYADKKQLSRKEQDRREIDRVFSEFLTWVEDTMTTEDNPFIQVIAVLKGVA